MHKISQLLAVVVTGLALVVVGCGSSTTEKDKMKMKEDKMKEDKMKDDKMKDDKMKDDKMKDDKMKGDKMKDDKMKSGSLRRPWTAEQPQLASSRLHFGSRVYGV